MLILMEFRVPNFQLVKTIKNKISNTNYYYFDKSVGEVIGPKTKTEMERLRFENRISDQTQVTEAGVENWQPFQSAIGQILNNIYHFLIHIDYRSLIHGPLFVDCVEYPPAMDRYKFSVIL